MANKCVEPEKSEEELEESDIDLGSSVKYYLDMIGNLPLLSPKKEFELATKARAGDEKAKQDLIKANLKLVIYKAMTINQRNLSVPDLIQEGNLGLIKAVDNFNPDLGNRFSTFAGVCIERAMINAVKDYDKFVRVPSWIHEAYIKINRLPCGGYFIKSGNDAEMRGLHLVALCADIKIDGKPISFEQLVTVLETMETEVILSGDIISDNDNEEDKDYFLDSIPDQNLIDHCDSSARSELREALFNAIKRVCPKKWQNIIVKRFGLSGDPPMTLLEVGRGLGCTRENIRQLEYKGLKALCQDDELRQYVGIPNEHSELSELIP